MFIRTFQSSLIEVNIILIGDNIMTLALFLECCDGVVMASDTQSTIGDFMKRAGASKINKINDQVLWAGSGDDAFLSDIEEEIEKLRTFNFIREGMNLSQMKDLISDKVYSTFLRYKEKFDKLKMEVPYGTIILATFNESNISYNGLLIDPTGTPYRINGGYETIGSSKDFAEVLLKCYYSSEMDIETGKKLAHWIIHQCSKTDLYVNEDVTIYIIKKGVSKNIILEETVPENIDALNEVSMQTSEVFKSLFHGFSVSELIEILKNRSEKASEDIGGEIRSTETLAEVESSKLDFGQVKKE